MLEQEIRTLNARIDSLIQRLQVVTAENIKLRAATGESQGLRAKVEALQAENNSLRGKESALNAEKDALVRERDELARKNDLARARVEAIILRLKALETPES